jgi:serine/threonine protein kinase
VPSWKIVCPSNSHCDLWREQGNHAGPVLFITSRMDVSKELPLNGYTPITILNSNTRSKVLKVRNNENKKLYALKIVSREFQTEATNERSILLHLSHPNIIQYLDCFTHKTKMCLLLECGEGIETHELSWTFFSAILQVTYRV